MIRASRSIRILNKRGTENFINTLISDNPVSFDNLHSFEKPNTPQLSVICRSRFENTYQKSVLTRAFIYWAVKRAHVALIDVWCGRGLARVCFWRKLEQKCDFVFNYVILEEQFNVYIWSSVSFNVWGILLHFTTRS